MQRGKPDNFHTDLVLVHEGSWLASLCQALPHNKRLTRLDRPLTLVDMKLHPKYLILFGSIVTAAAIALAAYGAHRLNGESDLYAIELFQKAIKYAMLHGPSMLIVAMLARLYPSSGQIMLWGGAMMALATVLFCGSLLFIALTGIFSLKFVTPVGGTLFIIAWLTVAAGAFKIRD